MNRLIVVAATATEQDEPSILRINRLTNSSCAGATITDFAARPLSPFQRADIYDAHLPVDTACYARQNRVDDPKLITSVMLDTSERGKVHMSRAPSRHTSSIRTDAAARIRRIVPAPTR